MTLVEKSKPAGIVMIILFSFIILIAISSPLDLLYQYNIQDVKYLTKCYFYIFLVVSAITVPITRVKIPNFQIFARVFILSNISWWIILYVGTKLGEYTNLILY